MRGTIKLGLSRKINEGYVEDNVLKMSREANDWSESHPYGYKIQRQAVIKSGICLKLLRKFPHPNIMQVLDFDDNWVYVEYLDGQVLCNRHRWCPEVDKARRCALDMQNEIKLGGIKSAIRHLHSIGVAHTDITSFNIMVVNRVPKLIDLVGCMPLCDEYEDLDWWCFQQMKNEIKSFYGASICHY